MQDFRGGSLESLRWVHGFFFGDTGDDGGVGGILPEALELCSYRAWGGGLVCLGICSPYSEMLNLATLAGGCNDLPLLNMFRACNILTVPKGLNAQAFTSFPRAARLQSFATWDALSRRSGLGQGEQNGLKVSDRLRASDS